MQSGTTCWQQKQQLAGSRKRVGALDLVAVFVEILQHRHVVKLQVNLTPMRTRISFCGLNFCGSYSTAKIEKIIPL